MERIVFFYVVNFIIYFIKGKVVEGLFLKFNNHDFEEEKRSFVI